MCSYLLMIRLYFDGGHYLWKKWASYKGLMGCGKYKDGYYCMQVDFANHIINCMEASKENIKGICSSFGFTKKYISNFYLSDMPSPINSMAFDYYSE